MEARYPAFVGVMQMNFELKNLEKLYFGFDLATE